MQISLQLDEEESAALLERARAEGISMEAALHRAVRDYALRPTHVERVTDAAIRVSHAHRDALDQLGS